LIPVPAVYSLIMLFYLVNIFWTLLHLHCWLRACK
jgi:hypothetical protein